MKRTFKRTLGVLTLTTGLLAVAPSCVNDLNQTPDYQLSADQIYGDPNQAYQVLARLYSTFAVTGQTGPAGAPDLSFIDEGFSSYIRMYWQLQEITTDEAVIGWNDGNLPALNTLQWNADNEFVRATYDRIFYEIGLCNEFIRQTTDERMTSRGLTAASQVTMRQYRSEARLLRALCYWHAIDLFGGGPFATETSQLNTVPTYRKGSEMFTYVESELKALDALDANNGALLAPRGVYARADQGVLWTLLTKLYLNARVYTGTERSADAITYSNKVLAAGYTLSGSYANLFLADNNTNSGRNEIIFPITFDGTRTQTYGGTTYLTHAPAGRANTTANAGIASGEDWKGLRTKPNLALLFGSATQRNGSDARSQLFIFQGQNPNVDTIGQFTSGPLISKYRNITSAGNRGSNSTFVDIDYPMFRLADVMLMKAEAIMRTNGTAADALALVNQVRARSGAPAITAGNFTIQTILDERGRELFWEGSRRTDLIRFGRYTTGYNWPFKGNVAAGQDVPATRSLFPIPNSDLVANPSLPQNPGY